ncbi:MAG: glycosyltransferase family 4 protein [Rhodoferax sp.]|nr:glycosyltransferase family 4 protein [Rhodoferax sp.]MCF8211060.1 glycosyltransferase family 4 protein [Rhodoferax sp.]
MKIAVLNRKFCPTGGGAERYSIALVEQFARDHAMHVFAQHIDHHIPGVTYHTIPAGPSRPRWVNQLWFAFATWWQTRKGFDIVHSHELTWHGTVQTVHVVPVKYNLFHGRSGIALALQWVKVLASPRLLAYLALEHYRYALRPGKSIVLASTSLRNVMVEFYPTAASMLQVVTPGVSAVTGRSSPEEKRRARVTMGLPALGKCILFVGNDFRKKGLATLLDAVRSLPKECYLAVVGNSAQIAGFDSQVRISGVADRVFFLGALSEMELAYHAADCLAHPTLEDTFAMVVLEAMSYGLPVVVSASRYCGIAHLLNHRQNALILPDPKDATVLTQSLARALYDMPQINLLTEEGPLFAKKYLWSEQARLLNIIYFANAKP